MTTSIGPSFAGMQRTRFAGNQQDDWKNKLGAPLKFEYIRFQTTRQDKNVDILLLGEALTPEAEEKLKEAGFLGYRKVGGLLVGTLPLSKLPEVAKVEGVSYIEKSGKLRLEEK